ncbi:MAG: autotransporter outer membrane beta-barrel domain-containing protein [Comamonadaceae bacterium]|nr:MAG: autotransporter outer membrane beta-barrel domain-containing protein [Comamonadaceae bacterium]
MRGGNGGNGGTSGAGAGSGGSAGTAIVFGGTGMLTNAGTIAGGNAVAAGGVGITAGGGVTIVNGGSISGGTSSGGVRADAIQFTGGGNTLQLLSGQTITGNVVATAAGGDTLNLAGTTTTGTFDTSTIGAAAQYRNFSNYLKSATGTWTLTGTTSAQTPWNVTGGTLAIANDASLGANSGALTLNGGTLQATATTSGSRAVTLGAAGGGVSVNAGATLSWIGVASGAGVLTKSGAGTLVLTAANNYSGGTTISAGTLQLGAGGMTGSILGDITNNGALVFNRSNALGIAGAISGTGTVTQGGSAASVTTLTGSNTYTGATNVTTGTLALGGTGGIANSSGVVVGAAGTFSIAGRNAPGASIRTLSGAGAVALGAQTLTLTNAAGTFSGVIGGTGALAVTGGTEILTGNNTYTGTTIVGAGATLQLGAGGATGSVSGNIANNGSLVLNRSNAQTMAAAITGTGSLTQSGTGITTLTGASNFSGATNVNAGGLRVDGTLGTGAVNVAAGASLGGSGTIGGAVTVANAGVLQLTQGQTLTTGALTLNSTSTVNAALGAPGSTTALAQVNGALTLDGQLNVTDLGGFGAGVYRLMNYTGALTDNGLQVGAVPAGSSLSVQTAVAQQVNLVNTAGQTLAFWDGSNTANFNNGAINGGSGTWTTTGSDWTNAAGTINAPMSPQPGFAIFQGTPGTVTANNTPGNVSVTGMQFAADGYVVQGDAITLAAPQSIIRVGDGSTAGAQFVATISAPLAGTARLEKTDAGTLVLTGANTYSGGTLVSGGTLQGNTTSLQGDIENNANLVFDQTTDGSYAAALSGSGTLRKTGAGVLTLAAANSYSGGTLVAAGTLIGNAASFGSGAIVDNAALVVNQTSDATMANVVSGTGTLTKTGGAALNLTGNSSAFTGTTQVAAGTLAVNGTLGGTLTVANGATLKGNGTVGSTTVLSGGTVAPGNSIGLLNVNGNLTLANGSTYQIEASSDGRSDRIHATGTAMLQGGNAMVLAADGNWNPYTTYRVLSADGGITGSFGSVSTNFAFLDPRLSYDAQNVTLSLTRNDVSFRSLAFTPNQRSSASALEIAPGSDLYRTVVQLSAPAAVSAFDQLSGEIHASLRSSLVEESHFVRDAAIDRLRQAQDGAAAPTDMKVASDTDGAAWGRVYGSWAKTRSDGNAASTDRSTSGIVVGADRQVGDWRVGVLGGASRGRTDVDARSSTASIDSYNVGVFGGTRLGGLALRTGLTYSRHDIETRRTIAIPGLFNETSAKYHGNTVQAFGELAWRIEGGPVVYEPFASLAHVNLQTDAFSERGGLAALTGYKSRNENTFTTIGLRASSAFDLGGMQATLRGTVGWRHAFNDTSGLAVLATTGGGGFGVAGVPIATDAAVIEAGIDFALQRNLTLGVTYAGQLGNGVRDHGAKANLLWKF